MSNKVIVNTDNWPICTLNSFPSSMDETRLWLEEMDLLLSKREQFALVYPPVAPKGKPSAEDMEGMKYVRRWLKQAKEPMMEYCRAMVVTLQPDGSDKDEMERLAPMLSALYGPEVFLETDALMAQERARKLLS
ncbi:MAG TPA: hypothetical protein DD649_19400 [Providencia sp.]|uniref:hypothetical protein n=2 Tax=Providencia sp. TaxID=589 RepID=UPI000E93B037|nr:hypothetical protein [Providencia sp.]MBP6080608.1 hypothetical protein [Providencia sp.]HBO25028.1 hypothetical protein [Providencia sp.]